MKANLGYYHGFEPSTENVVCPAKKFDFSNVRSWRQDW